MKLTSLLRLAYRGSGLKSKVMERRFESELNVWKAFSKRTQAAPSKMRASSGKLKVLVVPPDPLYLTHSRGDQAMLSVVADWVRGNLAQDADIFILTSGPSAMSPAEKLGCTALPLLEGLGAQDLLQKLYDAAFDHAFLIGADTIDGKMNPVFSQKLILAIDAVRLSGGQARVMGFSYSKDRFARMGETFDQLQPDIRLQLRDPNSLERLSSDTARELVQVADLAFLLQAARVADLPEAQWIASRKAEGKRVIGLNFNPMAFEGDSGKHERAASLLASVLVQMAKQQKVAFLLIAHDFRHDNSDIHSLTFMASSMASVETSWASNDLHASQIKGLCTLLDGVITARMHLAIASLGAGTPVCVVTYRNKFRGLLNFFEFDSGCLLSSDDFKNSETIRERLTVFIAGFDRLEAQISTNLPKVMALSRKNFDAIEVV